MSHYTTVRLKFTDKQALISSLEALEYKPVVLDQPEHLYGYQGDIRPETAEIIVPRHQISSGSNDLGFKFNPQTNAWDMIISNFDIGLTRGAIRIREEYVRQIINRQARAVGLVVHEVSENGKLKFVLTSPTGQITAEPSDTSVQIRVNGVLGAGCLQFSQALESLLGDVEHRQQTAEYYAQQMFAMNQQQIGEHGYYR